MSSNFSNLFFNTSLRCRLLRYIHFGIFFAMICLFISAYANAQPPEHWKESAYAYNAKGTPVATMLQDFADSFGVRLNASSDISGTSDGWLRADNAVEYLDRLSVKFKLQWFVYNNVLYVSPISDNVIKRIEISQDGAVDLKRALKGVGLLEEKFGWGEITDEGAILISGPGEYVSLVRSLVKMKEKKTKTREEVMVFAVQHAAVDDREIVIRNERIVIPGVATVLKSLLEKKRQSKSGAKTDPNLQALQTMEETAEERIAKNPWDASDSGKGSRRGGGVRVEADVRTNSILIHDSTSKRAYYEELIETLDVEKQLVEIEAIIVDIDRNKLKDLGVDWQVLNDGRRIASNISGIGQNPVNQFANGNATMLISDIDRFYASLRLLESQGEASVIANPSVLTIENQPAVIDLSETAYIETVGERVANVLPVTAGTMLRVTPRQIQGDKELKIQLVVDIEDGRILQENPSDLPRVRKNTIATKAVIDQDYSLVVGGYHIQERQTRTSKVPLIGDIPIVGKLFTSTTNDYSQRERLFILTPHISKNRHEVTAYTQTDQGDRIEKAVKQVKQKHERSSLSMLDRVKNVFKHLAQEELPSGYRLTQDAPSSRCYQSGFKFEFSQGRKISGPGLEVHIGVVENTTEKVQEITEASCMANGVVAVSVWPQSRLSPGEKAEIFVAREPEDEVSNRLPSLVKRP